MIDRLIEFYVPLENCIEIEAVAGEGHLHMLRYSEIEPLHNPSSKVATKSWASI